MGKISRAFRCFIKAWKDPEFARLAEESEKPKLAPPPKVPEEALQLLALLQEEGRLIDFLQEDISSYEDEQIGAAVRNIHEDCRKVLAQYFAIEPIMKDQEGEDITIEEGFDVNSIKLVGQVSGNPPFKGVVKHQGWKAVNAKCPPKTQDPKVIAPAEVEI